MHLKFIPALCVRGRNCYPHFTDGETETNLRRGKNGWHRLISSGFPPYICTHTFTHVYTYVCIYGFPGGTNGKDRLPRQEMQEMQIQSLGEKIPWRRKWYPTPVFLPGKFHGQRRFFFCYEKSRRISLNNSQGICTSYYCLSFIPYFDALLGFSCI